MTTVPVATTTTSAKAWAPDVSAFAPTDAVPEALILQTSTVLGSIEGDAPAIRVAWIGDDDAATVAEGADIDATELDLAEVTITTAKTAVLRKVSREQASQPGAEKHIADQAKTIVTRDANKNYVAALLAAEGIADGGEVSGDLDALVDLFAEIQSAGGVPTHIIVAPTTWASLRKLKTTTTSAESLLGAGTQDATPRLLGVPVIVSDVLAANTGLVLDKTAIASGVGQVQVAQSEHRYFEADSIALRVTWRTGAVLVRPDRCGKFTTPAAA